ncbi:putative NAD(P)H nitroreductase YfkO [Abditibacteriota bacterium]|nr:putative NAD(P)H nitroreductase YfkO [Abditibacteriota bacterium]
MSNTFEPTLDGETLLRVLNARYACKKFDSSRTIPDDIWTTIEDALVLSPSSYGLQPWKFIVVTDPDFKEELAPHAWNQPQIMSCSHLVVFCARRELGGDDVENLMNLTAQVRGLAATDLHGYASMIGSSISNMSPEDLLNWNKRQVYVALEQFLMSCALLGVDACPMEGFVPAKFDEILGLTDVAATVIATAGYRAVDDKYGSLPKVRYDKSDVLEHR